jgi:hypothetical protein
MGLYYWVEGSIVSLGWLISKTGCQEAFAEFGTVPGDKRKAVHQSRLRFAVPFYGTIRASTIQAK